ncbi:polysaccharide biosynthesis/export family protein [Dysgonomonas sp. GY617]|uniref:polysaccharide biosynthesis/export family protein n=1 Tax=Dysgonomonas sp. GY617 TaxID=2780420 RepID=UPI00188438BD|nr:polysaccharide biosynthesis/export family protein [Dysgonomonas sp. GY617]MBF0576358.1 polysaccharide biosynthesis/export family protein [Dysgonomonas sp. GY617]
MKKGLKYFCYCLIIGLTTVLHSSCTSPKTTNLLQDKGPLYAAKPFEDYKLQINDEISCSILTSNKDFSDVFNGVVSNEIGGARSSSYPIVETGDISIPFFGEIQVLGLTIPEAEEVIQNKMRQAIPDAQVKVFLKNNYYYVVSKQQNGRQNIYKDNMTIFQALAINGMPGPDLELEKVKIIRLDETGRSIIKEFDLRAESIIESEFYYIKPNDMIYYSTSKRAFFRINSVTGLIATIIAPITAALVILSFRIN